MKLLKVIFDFMYLPLSISGMEFL